MTDAKHEAPAREGGAIARWRGENIPYTCPYPSIGVRGSPYGYNIDPGAGSGMDRLQRNWPDRAQVRDMRERDGEITPLFPAYALTPRHEAPASACQKCGGEIAGWLCQQCPAEFRENDAGALIFDHETTTEAPELALEDAKAFGIGFIVDGARVSPDRVTVCRGHEAPAEGAGEAMDAGFEAWLNERNLLPHGAWDWPSIVAMLNHHEDALRARSSAPEAREGVAVGWKYEVFGPEGRSRSVRGVIGPKPNVAAPVGGYVLYDALYTHSAAPSADKLRIAGDALDRIATVDMGGGFLGADACRQVARKALIALRDAATPDALKGDAK